MGRMNYDGTENIQLADYNILKWNKKVKAIRDGKFDDSQVFAIKGNQYKACIHPDDDKWYVMSEKIKGGPTPHCMDQEYFDKYFKEV